MFSLAALIAFALPACNLTQFHLALGPEVTEATGQHSLSLRLVNHGLSSCTLRGYPAIVFADRAGRIPFVVVQRGDQEVTDKQSLTVVVRPRHAAFVLANNYRCDLGNRRTATMVRVREIALRLTNRYRTLSWCGKGDPGSVLAVSPFAQSFRATLAHG